MRLSAVLVRRTVGSVAAALLAACGTTQEKNRVTIQYEQIANFQAFQLSPDAFSTTSAGNGMFVLYRLVEIDNTSSDTLPFVFDRHKVLTVTADQTSNVAPGAENVLLGPKIVTSSTVHPHTGISDFNAGLGCFIKNALTSNPQNLASTTGLVDLIHQVNQEQPVTMQRRTTNTQVKLIETFATPDFLQHLCSEGVQ